MLAVFERLDILVVERLLASASGEASLSLATFANQSATGRSSVPDAVISASFKMLFELKTEAGTVRSEQLLGHLDHFDRTHAQELLFVITPDPEQPDEVTRVDDSRIIWFNFAALDGAIQQLLEDSDELVGERSEFLLRELRAMFEEDGLLSWDDTVVVAARSAYDDYLRFSAYICQPGRAFKPGLTHMGFYRSGQIEPKVPAIVARVDNVILGSDVEERLQPLVDQLLRDDARVEGQAHQVFLLTEPDDPNTVDLPSPIRNTTTTASGRAWAWTLGQRYVTLKALRSGVETTAELDAN